MVMARLKIFQRLWRQDRQELLWFGLIAFSGLLTRLLFILVFPTQPVSDFLRIVVFAKEFSRDIFASGSLQWNSLNPGVSVFLSILFNLIPSPPELVARIFTAILTGLLPIIPFLVWRGVFSLRARVLAALLLAFYPGQIIFSGVIAQDNWVLLPAVALGALSIRILVCKSSGQPVWAAILYGLGVFIRQEMLVALLLLYIVALLGHPKDRYIANILKGAGLTAILIGLMIIQRGAATGQYSLTTAHLSGSMLGSYAPGAEMGWIEPTIFVAARAPHLFANDQYKTQTFSLIAEELQRRPVYQIVRITFATFKNLFDIEKGSAYWSVEAAGTLPPERQGMGAYFTHHIAPVTAYFAYGIHVLFLISLAFVIFRPKQYGYVLPVLAALALKAGIHALIVPQPRYLLMVVLLEILTVGSMLDGIIKSLRKPQLCHSGPIEAARDDPKAGIFRHLRPQNRLVTLCCSHYLKHAALWNALIAVGLSLAGLLAMLKLTALAQVYIRREDESTQLTYQFPISIPSYTMLCALPEGRLYDIKQGNEKNPGSIMVDFLQADPAPGATVRLICATTFDETKPLTVLVRDHYPSNNYPGRILQIVEVNGEEKYRRDISASEDTDWHAIPLTGYPTGTPLQIKITLLAQNPEAGWQWGRAALTTIHLSEKQP